MSILANFRLSFFTVKNFYLKILEMKPKEVDYWVDIHDENAKVSDSLKSFGNKKEQMKIMEGLSLF